MNLMHHFGVLIMETLKGIHYVGSSGETKERWIKDEMSVRGTRDAFISSTAIQIIWQFITFRLLSWITDDWPRF